MKLALYKYVFIIIIAAYVYLKLEFSQILNKIYAKKYIMLI